MIEFLKLNSRKVIIVIAGLLLVGLGIWFWLGRVDAKIIGKEATIKRVVFGDEKTENAYLSLPYTADSQKYLYANVMVDFNKDGKFASYQTGGKTQEEWVTQNMNTRVFKNEGVSFDFKLVDLDVETRQDFPIKVVLTKNQLKNWNGKEKRGSAYQTLTVKSIEKDDVSILYSPHPDRDGGLPSSFLNGIVFAQDEEIPNRPPVTDELSSGKEGTEAAIGLTDPQPTETKTKEKTIETLGREFNVFHSGVPDITQGENECAIMSTANSLLWLAKENKFTEKMPKSQDELVSELKTDLKWDKDGVDTKQNYLTGKKAFTARHEISMETHMVNVMEYDVNIVAKIAQELKKGQDVEISLAYWNEKADGTWEKTGGHMVTAVGATGDSDGSQILDIHDPLSPGPSKLDRYKVKGTRVIDYKYGANQVTYIRAAIAESPTIPPPTVTPSDSSTPTTPTPTATITSSPRQTPTTSSSPSASSSSPTSISSTTSSPSPTSTTPAFSGYYDKFFGDNVTTFGVKITPTELAGHTFNGLEINHNGQGLPAPYGSNTNLNQTGYDNSGWTCVCTGDKYRCTGSNVMQANIKTVWSLWFDGDINPPTSLSIDLLTDGTVTASTTLNYQ